MSLTPELEALRESVRSALADQADDSERLHKTLVGIGVLEIGQPTLAMVLEELGRALYSGPVLSTAVAAELVPALGDGSKVVGLALTQPGQIPVSSEGGVLNGTASYVLDGDGADALLVEASDGLYLVDALSTVTSEPLATTDLRRALATVTFTLSPATRLDVDVEHARAAATVALACEQVGGAQAALDSAVEYSKIRSQFGRQIGSFQSIKHLASDMFVAVESARAAVRHAAALVPEGGEDLIRYASIAKAAASDAYVLCGENNVQIHGGIGFTWEHSAHLHLRRAKSSELLFGDAAFHRSKLADLLGI